MVFQNSVLMGAVSALEAVPDLEFDFVTSHGTDDDAKTYTFSGDLGSNSGDYKHVIVGITSGGSAPFSTNFYPAVTIAGVTATGLVKIGSANNDGGSCLMIAKTTATTGDIVITFGASTVYRADCGVWQMVGGKPTPTDSFTSTASPATGSIDVPAPGGCVGIFTAWTSSTATWTGLTEDFDRVGNGSGSGASDFFASGATGRTVSVTPSGSPTQRSLCVAAFAETTGYIEATGGTITTDGDYKVHTFNSSGTFTVLDEGKEAVVEYLCIAGGGGGGKGNTPNSWGSGGAGAGGYLTATDYAVTPQAYTVTIGGGGSGASSDSSAGSKGTDSVFATITSEGGGAGAGGGHPGTAGGDGGSGGGGTRTPQPNFGSGNAGPPRQGYDGGDGTGSGHNSQAGGGGAGEVGDDATPGSATGGLGGDGLASSITGASVTRGGGGGGTSTPGPAVAGGAGGGGTGAVNNSTPGTTGTANTGGGGGAGGGGSIPGSAGGSGVVIIRYQFQ